MKGYEDIAATLLFLSAVLYGGYYWMNIKTKEIEQVIVEQHMVVPVKTAVEKTIFERSVKHTE